MKLSLMVLSAGSAAGKALSITTPQFLIGRDPECHLRPASAMISKRHCALFVRKGRVFLRDFDSTNGTLVNDEPVKGEIPLKDGDILQVGPLSFQVVIENKPTPAPQPKNADIMDDDAAALMLSFGDGDEKVDISSTETAEDSVPSGSTVLDFPAALPEGEQKPEVKKPAAKPKPAALAHDAARAILDKMRQGKRT